MLVAEAHQLTEPSESCKAPTATLGPSPARRNTKSPHHQVTPQREEESRHNKKHCFT